MCGTTRGLRLGYDSRELARLRVNGIGAVLALRLQDPCRLPQVKSLLLEVGEAARAHEAVEPAGAIALDEAQQDGRRCEAMGLIGELGGDDDLLHIEAVLRDRGLSTEADRRVYGMLLQEAYRRRLWPAWQLVLRLPAVNPDLGDARTALQYRLREAITLDDARELLPHLRTLFDRHADEERWNRFPELVDRIITLLVAQIPPPSGELDALINFALSLINDRMGWSMARDLV